MLRPLWLMLLAVVTTLWGRVVGRPRHPDWSFSFEMIVRYLRLDWEDTADWDLARLSKDMDQRPYPRDYSKRVQERDVTLGGVPGTEFVPPTSKTDGVVLFLHGGSYLFGSSKTTHREIMARVAHDTGARVFGPDFRSTPTHTCPAQLDDALTAFQSLLDQGISAQKVVVVGDSSGGNLAVELALALRDRGREQPRALVLISPWVDLEMPGQSFITYDRYDFGTRDALVRHARAFAQDIPLSDPRISPTNAVLEGLCPCLVVFGEVELPRDDIESFVSKLKAAQVDTVVHMVPAMPHNPPAFAAFHPPAASSVHKMTEYCLRKLTSAQ